MKVMIVARGYPTNRYIMNGIFEFDQAKALAKEGVEVFYAAIDVRSIRRWRKWGFERKTTDGVEVFAMNLPCGKIPRKIRNRITQWALKKIYQKIRDEQGKPDLIHAHFIGAGYKVAQVFGDDDIPLVLTEHYSGMNQSQLSPYFQRIGEATYHRMDLVLAVSEHLSRSIDKHFNVEAKVLPNVTDLSNFHYNPVNRRNNKQGFRFISVGRLHRDKGMDHLISAFHKAFGGKEDRSLHIFGDGPERRSLEKFIEERDLGNQIHLRGMAGRETIAKEMEKSDCFVLASKGETFGLAYVEAMAMGLPVISTKCGGPESFMDKDKGILVPVDDENALINALKEMTETIHNYDPLKISNSVRDQFSSERITRELIGYYHELIREGKEPQRSKSNNNFTKAL